jgi:cytochrome c biogenesis factor
MSNLPIIDGLDLVIIRISPIIPTVFAVLSIPAIIVNALATMLPHLVLPTNPAAILGFHTAAFAFTAMALPIPTAGITRTGVVPAATAIPD